MPLLCPVLSMTFNLIKLMFQHMVNHTEPICQLIDSSLAQMLTFDTSGIELHVTENNPKRCV